MLGGGRVMRRRALCVFPLSTLSLLPSTLSLLPSAFASHPSATPLAFCTSPLPLLQTPFSLSHSKHAASRFVNIPRRMEEGGGGQEVSVTGPVYEGGGPKVTLYTKFECTLCDKVKDVLLELKDSHPHSLDAVDITDADKKVWWDRYKYDIPVLHINGAYWTKHKLTQEEAIAGIGEAVSGEFKERRGQPNAAAMEK